MTHYQELGLTPDASVDDIRKAHRQISRLLHPDVQTNPETRGIASIQMSRINDLVGTLLDPRRRHEYDLSLRAAHTRPPRTSVLNLLGIAAAAILLTVGTVWFTGGDMPRLRTNAELPLQSPPPAVPEPVSRSARPRHRPAPSQRSDPAVARGESGVTTILDPPPAISVPPSEPPALISPVLESVPPEPSIAGLWIYAASPEDPSTRRSPYMSPSTSSCESTLKTMRSAVSTPPAIVYPTATFPARSRLSSQANTTTRLSHG